MRTVVLTFDNLGEVAELEQGVLERPEGDHPSVTTALPRLLEALDELELRVTFFVEGLNTELYPGAVKEIAERGHEIGMHGWLHERWHELDPARGDRHPRPLPGGLLALRDRSARLPARPEAGSPGASRRCARPASTGARPRARRVEVRDGMAVLPFRWELVDATYLHRPFGSLRRKLGLPEAPLSPEDFERRLWAQLEALPEDEPAVVILHPFLTVDDAAWAAERRILERLAELRVVAGGALAGELR